MTRTHVVILLAAATVAAAAAATSFGCAPSVPPSAAVSQSSPAQVAPGTPGVATAVTGLAPSEKRASIAADFPAEVPAPEGDYTNVVAQGGNAWDYEVAVDATAEDLMRWYREAYTGRGWTAVEEGRLNGEGPGGTFAVLRKGAAQTHVRVYGGAQASPSRAVVTVGVGAPVLDTQ